jgi:cytochrome bd-type quinol oxidase subunit 1
MGISTFAQLLFRSYMLTHLYLHLLLALVMVILAVMVIRDRRKKKRAIKAQHKPISAELSARIAEQPWRK